MLAVGGVPIEQHVGDAGGLQLLHLARGEEGADGEVGRAGRQLGGHATAQIALPHQAVAAEAEAGAAAARHAERGAGGGTEQAAGLEAHIRRAGAGALHQAAALEVDVAGAGNAEGAAGAEAGVDAEAGQGAGTGASAGDLGDDRGVAAHIQPREAQGAGDIGGRVDRQIEAVAEIEVGGERAGEAAHGGEQRRGGAAGAGQAVKHQAGGADHRRAAGHRLRGVAAQPHHPAGSGEASEFHAGTRDPQGHHGTGGGIGRQAGAELGELGLTLALQTAAHQQRGHRRAKAGGAEADRFGLQIDAAIADVAGAAAGIEEVATTADRHGAAGDHGPQGQIAGAGEVGRASTAHVNAGGAAEAQLDRVGGAAHIAPGAAQLHRTGGVREAATGAALLQGRRLQGHQPLGRQVGDREAAGAGQPHAAAGLHRQGAADAQAHRGLQLQTHPHHGGEVGDQGAGRKAGRQAGGGDGGVAAAGGDGLPEAGVTEVGEQQIEGGWSGEIGVIALERRGLGQHNLTAGQRGAGVHHQVAGLHHHGAVGGGELLAVGGGLHLPEGLALAVGGVEVDLAEIDRGGATQVAVDGACTGHIAGAEAGELAGIAEIRGGAGGVQRAGADVLQHLINSAHQIGRRRAAEQLGIGGGEVVVIAIRDRNQHRAAGAAHVTAGHQGEVGGADGGGPAAAGNGFGLHVGGLTWEQLQEQGGIERIVIGVVTSYPLIEIGLLLGLWALVDVIRVIHAGPGDLLHRGQPALVGADRRAHIALVDQLLHLGGAEHKRAPARKRVGRRAPAAIRVLAGIAVLQPVVGVVAGVLAGHLLISRRGGGPRWGVRGAVGDAEGGVLLGQGGGVDRIDRQAGGIQQAPATHREHHVAAAGDGVAGAEAAG